MATIDSYDPEVDFSDGFDYNSIPGALLNAHPSSDNYPDVIDYSLVPDDLLGTADHLSSDDGYPDIFNNLIIPDELLDNSIEIAQVRYSSPWGELDLDTAVFDSELLDTVNGTYNGVALAKLKAAPEVYEKKISLVVEDGRGSEVLGDLKENGKILLKDCVYCLATNPVAHHSRLHDCPGPLGSSTDHYQQFCHTLTRSTLCETCWSPKEGFFLHAEGAPVACSAAWRDVFQGLPYIIWRNDALRSAVFDFLEVSGLESMVDFCQWNSQGSDERLPELTNSVVLIWAFIKLKMDGKLPEATSFSGKSHFHTGLSKN
ncbi:hypothetical protein BDP27DRAFT_1425056 [Rhodocollybia butyracea]|uniref:Uncharacterized protein n=1 Tax=Rhodocollybia butyracea TaxID=206335 RepID=A0A9P5PL78_9AGAR|nr:hypothetical protein BDP27DRAFT_1425056 [Rhodocollybia butyracea]